MDAKYFLEPKDPMQKRYEALRMCYVEKLPAEEVAKRTGYSTHTIYYLKKEYKTKDVGNFFLPLERGNKKIHKKTDSKYTRIIELRKRNYSIEEIEEILGREGTEISYRTISKILVKEGFAKLYRRTKAERLEILQGNRKYPEVSNIERFGEHEKASTSFGGIYLFIPIITKLGIDKLFSESNYYGTEMIPRINYLMSYLALKLLGRERLSHISDYSFDYGLGIFAGLNVLSKNTAITQYSYRHGREETEKLIRGFGKILGKNGLIEGKKINLDFHSVPHYGEESELEENWIATRNKRMKRILVFFAQDLETTYLCYSNGDIKNEEQKDEIIRFVEYYKETYGMVPECLVFDSKLTTYGNLNKINKEGIRFITLGRRGKKFVEEIKQIKEWEKIKLEKIERKYQDLRINEQKVEIKDYEGYIRQIIVTGTGRELPMKIITNDFGTKIREIIMTYAQRWRLENNLQENVDFFNLNALSSPIIVKVDFDIAMTIIGNSMYKILAKNIRFFEKAKPNKLFRNFVEANANIEIINNSINIYFNKKSFNPLIMEFVNKNQNIRVSWMKNYSVNFYFKN